MTRYALMVCPACGEDWKVEADQAPESRCPECGAPGVPAPECDGSDLCELPGCPAHEAG
jgi:predicted amidophosphoribosyltransferase